jgi:hypothetical protein
MSTIIPSKIFTSPQFTFVKLSKFKNWIKKERGVLSWSGTKQIASFVQGEDGDASIRFDNGIKVAVNEYEIVDNKVFGTFLS